MKKGQIPPVPPAAIFVVVLALLVYAFLFLGGILSALPLDYQAQTVHVEGHALEVIAPKDASLASSKYTQSVATAFHEDGYTLTFAKQGGNAVKSADYETKACLNLTLTDYNAVAIEYSYAFSGGGSNAYDAQHMQAPGLTASCIADDRICGRNARVLLTFQREPITGHYLVSYGAATPTLYNASEPLCWHFSTSYAGSGTMTSIQELRILDITTKPLPHDVAATEDAQRSWLDKLRDFFTRIRETIKEVFT